MAESVYDNGKLYFDGYDVSGDMNSIALALEADKADITAMGANTRKNLAGLKTINYSLAGFIDEETTGVLPSAMQANGKAITICPDGATQGSLAYPLKGMLGGYTPGGAVGDAAALSAEGVAEEYGRGKILHNGSITATGDGTITLVSEASGAVTFVGCVHVTAKSGTDTPTLTVSIYSDAAASFLSPTLIGTFAAQTGISGETLVVSGAFTDKYLRASWTVSGTNPNFTVVISGGFQKS